MWILVSRVEIAQVDIVSTAIVVLRRAQPVVLVGQDQIVLVDAVRTLVEMRWLAQAADATMQTVAVAGIVFLGIVAAMVR